jgi:restriction system protein
LGALISLFISLIMMVVSLTMSLLMTMLNLLLSLFSSGSRTRRRSGSSVTGAIVLVVIVVVVVGALLERPGWIVVLAVVGLVLWLLLRKSGPRTPTAQELAQRFGQIHLMSGGQFEIFIADLVRAMGYKATVLGGSGDQGVDVIAATGAERIAIQCKNYRKAVGNKPVQEVFAGARHHRCQQAWVVAPAGFTKGAFELARSVGVWLFDANSIRKWIKQADEAAKQSERDSAIDGKTRDESFRPLEL